MHKLSCAQGHALYIAGDIDFSFVIPNVSIYLPYQYLHMNCYMLRYQKVFPEKLHVLWLNQIKISIIQVKELRVSCTEIFWKTIERLVAC